MSPPRDADEANGTHFLVMEYISGSDLSEFVKEVGPLPIRHAVECILQAARGLSYAHGEGVIHRDIKPANLLLDDTGRVKILDMGLARLEALDPGAAGSDSLTETGTVMGPSITWPPNRPPKKKSSGTLYWPSAHGGRERRDAVRILSEQPSDCSYCCR